MKYVIKTFDNEYGDDLFVADTQTCNLTQKEDEAETFNTIEETTDIVNEMSKDFPDRDFEIDKIFTPKYVYMLVQHQMDTEYDNKTIAIYSDEEKAWIKCKELNKRYAENVVWIAGEEYETVDSYDEYYHYYTVEGILMDNLLDKEI